MAQKLEQDLNIIQRSGIEIQIDPLSKDLNIIQKLDDEPNDVGGLSAQQLKEKFDEAGNAIKEFINDSLIPQVLGDGLTEQNRQENELVRQANEAQRQANEQVRQSSEEEREEAETARGVWEDYDPTKDYVPGNKVYYLGSSYVNKAACKDVLPTVAVNWQMIAKKGADSDEGMSQDEADLRYLQLSGGRMTGQMTVLSPEADENPATKGYVDTKISETNEDVSKELAALNTAMTGKQNKLSGLNGRFLGFNAAGTPVSKDVPSHFLYMVVFKSSGSFSPSSYGLASGDIINVLCVGGGGSGYDGLGGGKDGDLSSSNAGKAGKGYGAGGGGSPQSDPGGGSGMVVRKTMRLNSTNSIPVTVGTAGSRNNSGGTSSFGTYCSAPGGTAASYNTPGTGNSRGGYGGAAVNLRTPPSPVGGKGGVNESNGDDGMAGYGSISASDLTIQSASGSGGGGAGGFTIPFSALAETTVGSGAAGDGVVVVFW